MTQASHSFAQQIDLSCLQCCQTFESDLWLVVDIVERPDLLEKIIQGGLHDFLCSNCNNLVYVNAPLLIYHPGGKMPLIFSPAQRTIPKQNKEQAIELLNLLRLRLGDTWQDEWLSQMPGVQRKMLPVALQDGLEAINLQMELVTSGDQTETVSIPQEFLHRFQKAIEAEERYKLGDREALNQAVTFWESIMQDERFSAVEERFRFGIYSTVGNIYLDRYKMIGDVSDLSLALNLLRQTVANTLPSSRARAASLNNLGNGLRALYMGRGKPEVLEEMLDIYRQAIENLPPNSPDRAMVLNNLGTGLRDYYALKGNLTDLEEAIGIFRQAISDSPPSSPDQILYLNNLGNALRDHYNRSGKLEDLEKALDLWRQVVAITPTGSPDQAKHLNNLGNGLRDHYLRNKDLKDLEESISLFRQAMADTPPGSPNRAVLLSHLGNSLRDRFARTGRLDDLEEAIDMSYRAVTESSPGSPGYAITLNNLGAGLVACYAYSDKLEDLEQMLDVFRQAVASTPSNSPTQALLLNNLGKGLSIRYARIGNLKDLQEAEEILKQAAELGMSNAPEAGLMAARNWGILALERRSWENAVQAYQICLCIAENLYHVQILSANQAIWMEETQGLATHAAYAFAQTGHLQQAVEIVESGRARLMRDALERNRKDLEHLAKIGHADLFERYKTASQRWEVLNHQTNGESNPNTIQGEHPRSDLVEQLAFIQGEIDHLVNEIRTLPGYEGFFSSLSSDQIRVVSANQPLVYMVASPVGGLALLLQPTGITPIWLEALTEKVLQEQVYGLANNPDPGGYIGAYANWREHSEDESIHQDWLDALDATTRWLWDVCMEKVVQVITSQGILSVVLIPSGLLGLLPLHAAWNQAPDASAHRCYALDSLQISYAPSAHSLLAAQNSIDRPADSILAVDNPDSSITFAGEATAAAIAHFDPKQVTRLEKAQATPEQVKARMQQAAVLQFYTHGTAGFTEPLDRSFLLLSDGQHLSLREILDLKLDKARLAFLAACETGIPGTKLIDEVISLPSGFLQAGVPGVIGSLWKVADLSTMLLVARFYDLWKPEDGGLAPEEALRQAQIWVRDTTNQEKQDFLRKSLTKVPTTLMPESAARVALNQLLLEDPEARLFAHPYYWAAFTFTGC